MKISTYGNFHAKKKAWIKSWLQVLDPSIKRMIIMRIKVIAFLIFLAIANVCASVHAQSISLNFKQAPLTDVLLAIKKQSGYQFLYRNSEIEKAKLISITIKNTNLKDALDLVFKDQPLNYQILDKTIVIKEKAEKPLNQNRNDNELIKITGKVQDEKGLPISGATVRIKGTAVAVVTDEKGLFSIETTKINVVVQVSFIGFELQEFTVSENSNLTITLKESIGQLDELKIAATGYQEIPKERATGSFTVVGAKQLSERVSPDLISRLDGIASGFLIPNKNIRVGANESPFTVRGRSTLFANTRPLVVVDNFPYEGDVSNINPNDVESVTLLKDAAAASIWGAFSGNGVIVITTKKAKVNQPLKVDFNTNVTIGQKPDIFYGNDFLNSKSYIGVEQYLFEKGFYDADISNTTTRPVLSPVVEILIRKRNGLDQAEVDAQIAQLSTLDVRKDFEKYFYQESLAQQYALNLSGGGSKSAYLLSMGYDKGRSNLVRNGSDRYTVNFNNLYNLTRRLDLSIGAMYVHANTSNNNGGYGSVNVGTKSLYPYASFVDASGNNLAVVRNYRSTFTDDPGPGLLDWRSKPIDELNNADNTFSQYNLRFNPGIKYTILPGLNAEIKYQYEKQEGTGLNYYSIDSFNAKNLINSYTQVNGTVLSRPVPNGGILDQNVTNLQSNALRAQINYVTTIKEKHEISAIAGLEQKEQITKTNGSRLYGYSKENLGLSTSVDYVTRFAQYKNIGGLAAIPSNASISQLNNEYISYFGNASYSYDQRYTVSGSIRLDQSNLFGVNTNSKGIPLWSSGISWNISNESFYGLNWLPKLKFRATYGYNGNIDKTTYGITTISNFSLTNIAGLPITNIAPANPELRWEKVGTWNMGIDFAAIDNIISGTIEYYSRKSTDLIGTALTAPSTGTTTFKTNVANMTGEGLDIQLNSKNLNGPFKWSTSLNLSYNKDKVTKYYATVNALALVQSGPGVFTSQILPIEGYPLYSVYSFKWAGLDATGNPQAYLNGSASKDYSALVASKDYAQLYHGPARPVVFGGFANNFSYRNFALAINITYKLGYFFRRNSINYNDLFNTWTGHSDFDNRWQKPGDELLTNVPSMIYPNNVANRDNVYTYSDILVEKGDHIRLQYIQLSYNLKPEILRKTPLKNLSIYGNANNVGILWRKNKVGLDPDYFNTIPEPRSFSIGLSSKF